MRWPKRGARRTDLWLVGDVEDYLNRRLSGPRIDRKRAQEIVDSGQAGPVWLIGAPRRAPVRVVARAGVEEYAERLARKRTRCGRSALCALDGEGDES